MMYSVRKNSKGHGNTNLHLLLGVLVITAILTWQYGVNYVIIFCSSSMLHLLIETGLTLSGTRKGAVYVYGRKLPRWADVCLRAFVDGPAFCVPAFFVADQFIDGNRFVGITGALFVVGLASLYMGMADRHDLHKLAAGEEPLASRRAMTRPVAVMLLALVNTICLIALFLIPSPYRTHALIYISAYSVFVMLFYLINYNLGVRMVEIYDPERKEYTKPGPFFQAAGLAYDSVYEMALLVSPAYWVTFYLGLFYY